MISGWFRMELGKQPGYDSLHRFLEGDFRRDLKNLGQYWQDGQFASLVKTNANEEFAVRFGLYLWERGYFKTADLPGWFQAVQGNELPALLARLQRLVADKMGVAASAPIPPALAFLGDSKSLEKSFNKYLSGTDPYRMKLKQWKHDQKLQPAAPKPEPSAVFDEAAAKMVDFELFGNDDHLAVHLSLPVAPLHTNGRWDAVQKQDVWESDIDETGKTNHIPFACYATWVQPDATYQVAHFGKTVLGGDDLAQYCLWRKALDSRLGAEWDDFLATLQPDGMAAKIEAFRFSTESDHLPTNSVATGPSAFGKTLLKAALR